MSSRGGWTSVEPFCKGFVSPSKTNGTDRHKREYLIQSSSAYFGNKLAGQLSNYHIKHF